MLFILNVDPVVSFGETRLLSGLATGLAGTSEVLDIPKIMQSFEHDKSSCILQSIKDK